MIRADRIVAPRMDIRADHIVADGYLTAHAMITRPLMTDADVVGCPPLSLDEMVGKAFADGTVEEVSQDVPEEKLSDDDLANAMTELLVASVQPVAPQVKDVTMSTTSLTPVKAPTTGALKGNPITDLTARVVHYPKEDNKFLFDETVAPIFENMAIRSIPGYHAYFASITQLLAASPLPEFCQVWDIGVSTGAGLQAVKRVTFHPFVEYYGTDISEPMLDIARDRCGKYATLIKHDITTGLPSQVELGEVGVFLFSWTLQFVSPDFELRQAILEDAYKALRPGGWIFVGEKFELLNASAQRAAHNLYYEGRIQNGYSLKEIRAKSKALDNSMWPWPPEWLTGVMSALGAEEHLLFRQHHFGGYAFQKPVSTPIQI
ncbi:tRNA (cmo5U34)-methyltransferase 2 [Stappia sp. 22II-S9-Z10]|nr:tRNA (cmo5U34)-methyltransferase 2 [Stappia sp. 22II-S9-Z10]